MTLLSKNEYMCVFCFVRTISFSSGNVPLIGHCQDTPSVQLSLTGLIHGRFEIDDRAIPEWYFTCMESSKTMGMYRILISDAEEIISDNGK